MENKIVSYPEWEKAHREFLAKEKEFTRMRDELSRQRQALPWVLVEKPYTFEGPQGKLTFGDLFDGRSQLFVQHFMFGPDWEEGCSGCSFQADSVSGGLTHLLQRDVTYVAISRAPIAAIEKFKKRMGWKFPWVSSLGSDFNFDFGVSFTEKQKAQNQVTYNFQVGPYESDEMPGNSAFYKDETGRIYRTYSSYARGCEEFMGTYLILDRTTRGRHEEGFKVHPMEWVRLHDRYEECAPAHCCDK